MTVDEITKRTEELSERLRQLRIAGGKPPEPPERFVEIPLSIVLAERVKAFLPIAVRYISLLAEGTAYPVDTDKFVQYREYARLLHMSKGTWCGMVGGGVSGILRIMDEVTAVGNLDEFDIAELVRRGHFSLKLMKYDLTHDKWDHRNDELPPAKQEALVNAEVARINNDPDVFRTLYDEALAKYETIKESI